MGVMNYYYSNLLSTWKYLTIYTMSEQISSSIKSSAEHLIAADLGESIAVHLIEGLTARYSEPWRFYHVVSHLGDVTKFLVDNIAELQQPRVTLWAGMYHDAIYVPQAQPGVNEELSAQLAEAELGPYLPEDEVSLIGNYVRRTADHEADDKNNDLAYLLDSDLLILGASEEKFDAYDADIRQEYSFVDPDVYKRERERILVSFYNRQYIFTTHAAREQYEARAKSNLRRKLK